MIRRGLTFGGKAFRDEDMRDALLELSGIVLPPGILNTPMLKASSMFVVSSTYLMNIRTAMAQEPGHE